MTDAAIAESFRRRNDPRSEPKFCGGRNRRDQSCDTHRFERGLVLHPHLKYETRRESDAKIAISLFDKQGLLNSGLKPSICVEILPNQQPQTRALYVKLAVQVRKSIMLASREFRVRVFLNGATPKRWAHQPDFRRRSRR